MSMRKQITQALEAAISDMGISNVSVQVTVPELEHGDYTTNIAMVLASRLKKSPIEIAEEIVSRIKKHESRIKDIKNSEVIKPGFINFWLSEESLAAALQPASNGASKDPSSTFLKGKRYLVEYAHPNTHKEMHIGHMRTLITGEAVSRLLEANGAEVFRANYQGDIGPHVAKALYGIQKIMEEKRFDLTEIESWSNEKKAHFLGEGYVRGNIDYEEHKEEIDAINNKLYESLGNDPFNKASTESGSSALNTTDIVALYQRTRQWSLDYYDDFYKRFYTKFDRLFFESEMVGPGKQIVLENLGKVFKKDNGAIIFPGEEYASLQTSERSDGGHGLHTRVFITKAGNPTYEGKEMGNGFAEYNAFPFDMKIHVVGSEQAGYFQVVFKALELIDPKKFKDKQHHISMGMVSVVGMKMSSRTGEILRVDKLIDTVKGKIRAMVEEGRIQGEDVDAVTEIVAIGAVKYSVLKVGTGQNVAFDIEKSVSLEGDSGPYLQYAYARTQSVLAKSKIKDQKSKIDSKLDKENLLAPQSFSEVGKLEIEENDLLRFLYRFPESVEQAGLQYSPNILCDYLFDLAKLYNNFYQKHKILGSEKEDFRLALTSVVGDTLNKGLNLLGIKAPERM